MGSNATGLGDCVNQLSTLQQEMEAVLLKWQEFRELQDKLKELVATIVNKDAQLAQLEERNNATQRILLLTEAMIGEKDKRIVEKDQRITQLENSQQGQQRNSSQVVISELNKRIKELEAQSVADVAQIKDLEGKLALNNSHITVTNTRIIQLESQSIANVAKLKTLGEQLSERDNRIKELETKSAEDEANLKELGEMVTEKDDRITWQEAQCSSDTAKVKELEAIVSDKNTRITELETKLQIETTNQATTPIYNHVSLPSGNDGTCLGRMTGVFNIELYGLPPFPVYCDSTQMAGPGWTVIQRRQDGLENFNRNWEDYKMGFGNFYGEYFIGLDKLHLITNSRRYELYVYLQNFKNQERYARYDNFRIGSEYESYKLQSVGNFQGNAGNALKPHENAKFSTPDRNNELGGRSCASKLESGWWFIGGCYRW